MGRAQFQVSEKKAVANAFTVVNWNGLQVQGNTSKDSAGVGEPWGTRALQP